MTESEIKMEMLTALRNQDLTEGRRLQKLRHELIERECEEQHRLIDGAFQRFWGKPSEVWLHPYRDYDTTIHEDGSISGPDPLTLKKDLGSGGYGS